MKEKEELRIQLAVLQERDRLNTELNTERARQSLQREKELKEKIDQQEKKIIETQKELSATKRELKVLKESKESSNSIILAVFTNHVARSAWNHQEFGFDEHYKEMQRRLQVGMPESPSPAEAGWTIEKNMGSLYEKEDTGEVYFLNTDKNRGSGIYKDMRGGFRYDAGLENIMGGITRALFTVRQQIYNANYQRWMREGVSVHEISSGLYRHNTSAKTKYTQDLRRRFRLESYNKTNEMKETKRGKGIVRYCESKLHAS